MKISSRYCVYLGFYGVFSITILTALKACKLEAFSYHLDMHANKESIEKEAKRIMQEDVKAREEAKYWKEYYERQAREKKEKEKAQRERTAEEQRRKDEEKKRMKNDVEI